MDVLETLENNAIALKCFKIVKYLGGEDSWCEEREDHYQGAQILKSQGLTIEFRYAGEFYITDWNITISFNGQDVFTMYARKKEGERDFYSSGEWEKELEPLFIQAKAKEKKVLAQLEQDKRKPAPGQNYEFRF